MVFGGELTVQIHHKAERSAIVDIVVKSEVTFLDSPGELGIDLLFVGEHDRSAYYCDHRTYDHESAYDAEYI